MYISRVGRHRQAVRWVGLQFAQVKQLSYTAVQSQPQPRRSTLSSVWVPTGLVSETQDESGHGKLVRAGFLRQAQSGIFHMLPLGLRVQEKIERLLDEEMQSIGASKVSLSSITSEDLWRKSGRFEQVAPELFRFEDRKQTPLMLGPTHEEEITTLVANTLKSYKDLPIKLYQTSRKYRDEKRPRHGLLRSREFLMKDLYTFDISAESAIETYRQVAGAYKAFFEKLKLPILVAEASSGDMGGDSSHEYHLAHPIGEDTVFSCDSCEYAANDEVVSCRPSTQSKVEVSKSSQVGVWRGITKDRKVLVNAWFLKAQDGASDREVNLHALKSLVPDLDTGISGDLEPLWADALRNAGESGSSPLLINLIDSKVAQSFDSLVLPRIPEALGTLAIEESTITTDSDGSELDLLRVQDGDSCPRCEAGTLKDLRALELGHTFYLGTRYSEPLDARVALPTSPKNPIPVEMGCYGLGISRVFASVAEHLADEKGLNWPRSIAPYEVVVIPTSKVSQETLDFYDLLAKSSDSHSGFDVILDDRKQSFGWKMQDADTIGYPVSIVLGRGWTERQAVEVQCRRLSIKEQVAIEEVPSYVESILSKL
ncbi:unnamed protein product [Clonostachys solani]|uniref:proline--tRNA ligase n=1 Tax=Clonostachys solani TaxID=160281 RepID=A0A9P0EFS3_9HYPO|nr:unnamed protein product [Clonostachys solani]